MRIFPSHFWIAFLLLWTAPQGYSDMKDTQKCKENQGTCHPTICPAQKMEKGTCYSGSQLCCVDCPSHFLSFEGPVSCHPPKFGLSSSLKILLKKDKDE